MRVGSHPRGFIWKVIGSLQSRQGLDLDRVEVGHAVGLGPKSHSASSRDGFVGRPIKLLAVKRDGKAFAFGLETERVPFIARNFEISACDLYASPIGDTLESNVVFKGVGAHHVIVVRINKSHRDATRPIDTAGNRFEPD